jgi:hypothetical protein
MADTVLATFQVKAGMVDRLSLLLDKHFATITRLGLGGGPRLDFPHVKRLTS